MNAPVPPHRLQGILLGAVGAIAFSGKAIIVKLAYRYGVDAVTVLMYRMLFAFPLFLALSWWAGRGQPRLVRADWLMLFGLGFSGYYLASFLDFSGLQYIGANLERLILYLNPTIVLGVSVLMFHAHVTRKQWIALCVSYCGVLVVFGHDITLHGDHIALGSLLWPGERGEFRAVSRVQWAGGEAPWAFAHHRHRYELCVRAVYRAVLRAQAAERDGGCAGSHLVVDPQRNPVHVFAGRVRDDGGGASRRAVDRSDQHHRADLDDPVVGVVAR